MMPFIKEYETISMDRRKYAHPWPIGLEREARTGVFVVPNELNRKKNTKSTSTFGSSHLIMINLFSLLAAIQNQIRFFFCACVFLFALNVGRRVATRRYHFHESIISLHEKWTSTGERHSSSKSFPRRKMRRRSQQVAIE